MLIVVWPLFMGWALSLVEAHSTTKSIGAVSMIKMAFRAIAAALLVVSTSGLASANYTFNLTGVALFQGTSPAGTLTGSFTTDNSLTTLVSADIIASPAGPTGGGFTFPGFEYTLLNSSSVGTALPGFFQLIDGSDEVRLIFNGGLTTTGATLSTSSFETEPGAGNRTVATGSVVVATAVPEPASIALTGSALAIVVVGASVRRRRKA